jgi:ectoine hydroxylase-related dioxygenase (phytanoyl-CoA dioxygenase family)
MSTTTDLASRYAFSEIGSSHDWVDAYHELGYVIISGVFSPVEVEQFALRFDRWYAEGLRHPRTFRHQNKVIWIEHTDAGDRIVRGMQWPSYEDHILDSVRTDPRMLALVEPMLGSTVKQIINQLHWKAPGSGITWGLHRDVRSRKPESAFRELATSYVQTGLAIDRHWAGNGAMQILPRSHEQGRLDLADHGGSRDDTGEAGWRQAGVDLSDMVDVEMAPGDVALWGPYAVHGGGKNTTPDSYRRLYINGYVIAENCDRGELAFDNGEPVALDLLNPAHIQYDGLQSRPEAHYAGDRPSD